jgi:hypothetical protein
MLPRPLTSAIIILVSVIWTINFLAPFVLETYKSDVTLNGVFMAIVGGALALSKKSGGSSGDKSKDEGDDK